VKRYYVAALGVLLLAPQAVAEQPGDDFFIKDVAGVSGQPVPLGAETNDAYPSSDLFTFAGLPAGVKLSAGGEWNGVWIVPRKDIRGLSLLSDNGLNAQFSIVVTRAQMPSRPQQSLTVRVTLSSPVGAAAPPPTAYAPSASEKMLLDKAADLLRRGDVSGARTLLEYLVAKGIPKASLLLGESYDPSVLSKLYTKGVEPDTAKAIEWYQNAYKLGSIEAKAHLDSLSTK
jgi:hypothetical protein